MRTRVLACVFVSSVFAACSGDNGTGDGGAEGGIDSGEMDAGMDTWMPDVESMDAMDGGAMDGGMDGDASSSCDGGMVTLSAVVPTFGWSQASTPITITGSGFVATPTASLVPNMVPDGGVTIPLTNVGFISPTSITARVPTGSAVGVYDLQVTNPDGCSATLSKAFTIVPNAPPKIISVQPATGTTQKDVPVVVSGCHFPNNSTISTIDVNQQTVVHSVQSVSCSGNNVPECDNTPLCTMNATIQTNTKMLAPGAYVVRVTNPTDMTWGDWSAFVVTDPSGKLTGNWTKANSLVTGRRAHGMLAGRLDDANRFLYVIGGEDAMGNALDTVEVAPLDAFGRLGKWFTQKYKLTTPRAGVAVVRQGRYLWAIGGTSSKNGTGGATPTGTPMGSIERAKILDPAGAPKLADPTTSMAGTLAKGTWYYRVSAVLSNADPDNPSGETLASDEKIVLLGAQGSVGLSWSAVPNADHYRVYRSPKVDGASSSEVLLKDNIMGTTFSDDGSLMPGMETPLLLGSTGVWKTVASQLQAARFDATASIAPESSAMNAPLHVYVLGGWGKCTSTTGAMNCYEYATINANGDALGMFTLDTTHVMTKARMRFGSTPVTSANGPTQFAMDGGTNTASFILVGGGYNISAIGNTVEYALVQQGGMLGNWLGTTGFANQRDGSQLIMVNGYAYAFQGGMVGSYSATSDLSTNAQVTPTTITFGNWSNAGANLGSNVGRHGVALESAYFYITGGTTNDNDALSDVYQIIY